MYAKNLIHRLLFASSIMLLSLTVACQALRDTEPEATLQPTAPPEVPAEDATVAPVSIPAAEPDTDTPAGVVDAFYTWYLDPERSGEFAENPYLSQRQIEAVRQVMQGKRLGADPFLLAQEVPAAIRVEEVAVGMATAKVVLQQYFNLEIEDARSWDLTVDLVREGGSWKIDRIQRGSPLTPEGVVQLFYNWYFNYGEGDRSLGNVSYALASPGNPLADRAYRASPYLAPELIAEVDAMMAQAPAYDPFLRARNHPFDFYVMIHEMEAVDAEATVPVQLMYGREQEIIAVVVAQADGTWRIVEVQGEIPDEATAAAQVVALFSSAYFGRWYAYAEEYELAHTGEDVDLAPFLAQAEEIYERSPFVSPAFAAASTELITQGDAATDPFFQASEVPAMMEIEEAWADGDHAEVRVLQGWLEGHETRPLTVQLAREGGRWLIDDVVPIAESAAVAVDPRAEMHPADVVRAFFAGYLVQGGYAGGAHRENGYLSPAYAESVESDVGYLRSLGIPVDAYDPILHSAVSALPDGVYVEVGAVTVDADRHVAVVQANRIYDGGASLPLTVFLTREWDNRWTIQDIGAVDPAGQWEEGVGATEALWLGMSVAAWYDWAVAYGAQPENVDELPKLMRFDMEAEGGMTFCTTSWPLGFAVDSVFLERGAEKGAQRAMMVVRSTEAHALLTLELEQREWLWAIVDQDCGDTPAGRAHAFYTTYLGAAGDPFEQRAFAQGDYLTGDLIMTLDNAGAPERDPLTLAPDTPQWIEVRPGAADNKAVVTLSFADGSTQEIEATFVLVDGRWLLSSVAPVD